MEPYARRGVAGPLGEFLVLFCAVSFVADGRMADELEMDAPACVRGAEEFDGTNQKSRQRLNPGLTYVRL